MAEEVIDRKPPRLFYSKKMDEKHRRHFNNAIRRNARGGDHFVTFHYVKEDGSRENKEVKPYTSKKSKDGKYLLVGYAKDRGELRSYRTDRIHHIKEAFWRGFERRRGERSS
jgi:predicted DNA-binding transcriptional regulator YafY